MMRRAPGLVAGLGVALAVAGILVFRAANTAGGGSRWASYTPLEPGAPARYTAPPTDGWAVLWTARHAVGAGLLVLGSLVLVGVAGWLLGRRSGRAQRGS